MLFPRELLFEMVKICSRVLWILRNLSIEDDQCLRQCKLNSWRVWNRATFDLYGFKETFFDVDLSVSYRCHKSFMTFWRWYHYDLHGQEQYWVKMQIKFLGFYEITDLVEFRFPEVCRQTTCQLGTNAWYCEEFPHDLASGALWP